MMKKQYLAVFSRRHKISTLFTPTHVSWMDYGSKSDVNVVLPIEKFLFGAELPGRNRF